MQLRLILKKVIHTQDNDQVSGLPSGEFNTPQTVNAAEECRQNR